MIKLENINYEVEGDKEILKDINLELGNEFVALTGPNGGGKSTLAKIIAGIVTPTGGRVYFDGEDITEKNITERANMGISYAFQQPVRFKGLKVRDLMKLAAGKDSTFAEACDILSGVGLCAKDYMDRYLDSSLSGGEMKRIEIAMAIARRTKYTIFDEPEAGIDLWSFNNLTQVFEKMQGNGDGGILVISHQERILNIADKILYLKDGGVVAYDEREKVLPMLLAGTVKGACPVMEQKMTNGEKITDDR